MSLITVDYGEVGGGGNKTIMEKLYYSGTNTTTDTTVTLLHDMSEYQQIICGQMYADGADIATALVGTTTAAFNGIIDYETFKSGISIDSDFWGNNASRGIHFYYVDDTHIRITRSFAGDRPIAIYGIKIVSE